MARIAAILQSSYIPWKGYFDLINRVDDFVLFDDAQYTRSDWRSRNRIKTANGAQWLSIPVRVHSLSQTIAETEVTDSRWRRKHWATIEQNYSRAACFAEFGDQFRALYLDHSETRLSLINRRFIETINRLLGITTTLYWSSEFHLADERSERLVGICQQLNATTYVSGPAAHDYLDEQRFQNAGIDVEWMDYSGYPEYPQLHPPFDHQVSILDLIFNTGVQAPRYMKSFGGQDER